MGPTCISSLRSFVAVASLADLDAIMQATPANASLNPSEAMHPAVASLPLVAEPFPMYSLASRLAGRPSVAQRIPSDGWAATAIHVAVPPSHCRRRDPVLSKRDAPLAASSVRLDGFVLNSGQYPHCGQSGCYGTMGTRGYHRYTTGRACAGGLPRLPFDARLLRTPSQPL